MRRFNYLLNRIAGFESSDGYGIHTFNIAYAIGANATAAILTGMKSDNPNVIELSWSDEKPADDGQKIRWLKQYTHEQISEIRAAWERSPCVRDAVALRELDRLFGILSAGDR